MYNNVQNCNVQQLYTNIRCQNAFIITIHKIIIMKNI